MRDQATHLLIPELEAVYAGLFQAGVFNYVDQRRRLFPKAEPNQTTPPLLSLVWEREHLEPKIIQKRYGRDALRFMQEQRDRVQAVEEQVGDRRFSISIEYKLVLTKKPKEADITLGAGPGGAIAGQIIEVPKDVSMTHPYTPLRAAAELKKRLGTAVRFTTYDSSGGSCGEGKEGRLFAFPLPDEADGHPLLFGCISRSSRPKDRRRYGISRTDAADLSRQIPIMTIRALRQKSAADALLTLYCSPDLRNSLAHILPSSPSRRR